MLLHHGATVEVGHYTAIVRVGGQCFTCDDLTVTPSTSHQLSDAGRSVYICLYEKTGLWFLYYLYPLRTHVFLFAVTAHLYPFFFSFGQLYCSTVSHHLRVGKNALNKYDQYAIYWGSATPVVFLMIGSGYLRCCDVLRKICHSAQLDDAQSITATNMRKCVSADSIGRETAWMALHEHGPLNTSTLQLCLSC